MQYLALALLLISVQASAGKLSSIDMQMGEGALCSSLAEALQSKFSVEFIDVPSEHQAGKAYRATIRLEKSFALRASDWHSWRRTFLQLEAEQPYRHIINLGEEDEKRLGDIFFDNVSETEFTFSLEIPKNVGG
jgi:hypothetical protein